jgi:hypothetical protein
VSIVVTDVPHASKIDQEFEDGWHASAIESAPIASGAIGSIHATLDTPCAIFYVTSALEVLGLIVGEESIPLVALDRMEDETREWRPLNGRVNVLVGTRVTFRIKNDGTRIADPLLAYISRRLRLDGG